MDCGLALKACGQLVFVASCWASSLWRRSRVLLWLCHHAKWGLLCCTLGCPAWEGVLTGRGTFIWMRPGSSRTGSVKAQVLTADAVVQKHPLRGGYPGWWLLARGRHVASLYFSPPFLSARSNRLFCKAAGSCPSAPVCATGSTAGRRWLWSDLRNRTCSRGGCGFAVSSVWKMALTKLRTDFSWIPQTCLPPSQFYSFP